MEKKQALTCISQAARDFGVERRTVADLVRIHGIPTIPTPYHGTARGIDAKGMKVLKKHLTPAKPAKPAN